MILGPRHAVQGAEARWFTGTDRAFPPSLTDLKDNGIRSQWVVSHESDWLWDFNLGTDMAVWDREGEASRFILGGRFGVVTRFEFGSESFDLWAVDVRGGAVAGWRSGDWAAEALFLHESSHLGDEILERGDRQRIDAGINEIRLSVSRAWGNRWRVFGSLSGIPWARPEELQSFGFRLGGEARSLPPHDRGYAAAEMSVWEWRDWSPDVVIQLGLRLGPRDRESFLSSARAYLHAATGAVHLGQFFDETETTFGIGMALDW